MFSANDITAEVIFNAYHQGAFPMAESVDSESIDFYKPEMRGQLSIDHLHIPKRLLRTLKKAPYEVSINKDFEAIIDGCAAFQKGRESSWINPIIRNCFIELHELGIAHSIECWAYKKDGIKTLAGGLYGLSLGRIFCGESMVSFKKDASKIALIHLCARLQMGRFSVLDTQFTNDHLKQFGVYEIPNHEYDKLLETEAYKPSDFILSGHTSEEILENYLVNREK